MFVLARVSFFVYFFVCQVHVIICLFSHHQNVLMHMAKLRSKVSGCQYECMRFPEKSCLQNNLLCVELDVKPLQWLLTDY